MSVAIKLWEIWAGQLPSKRPLFEILFQSVILVAAKQICSMRHWNIFPIFGQGSYHERNNCFIFFLYSTFDKWLTMQVGQIMIFPNANQVVLFFLA